MSHIEIKQEFMDQARKLWPELEWIKDETLRQNTTRTWALALQKSVLTPNDLNTIPFTLLCGPDLKVTFMDHKRAVVHIAKDCGEQMIKFFTTDLWMFLLQVQFLPMSANFLSMK